MELIWFFFIISIIAKTVGAATKKDKKVAKHPTNRPVSQSNSYQRSEKLTPPQIQRPNIQMNVSNQHSSHNPNVVERRSSGSELLGFEDRRHDWLAQEIREENSKAKEMCAMFDLKQSHMKNCTANRVDTATLS